MIDEHWKAVIAGLGSLLAVFATIVGRSWVRRILSRDRAILAADGGEVSVLQMLQQEIARRQLERGEDQSRWNVERTDLLARADRFAQERNDAIRKIGALEQEVHQLKQQVMDLSAMVEKFQHAAADHAREAEGLRTQVSALRGLIERGNTKPTTPDTEG